MAKKPLNPLATMVAFVEDFYSALPSPGEHNWSISEVLAIIGLCAVNHTNSERARKLSAAALLSLTPERRESILLDYEVNVGILDEIEIMGTTPVWPEALPRAQFEVMSTEDLDAYKTALVNQLYVHMDREAQSIIQGSPRMLMTQLYSALSAVRIENGLYAGTSPDPVEFPLVEASRVKGGLTTLEEAASQILTRGEIWATADVAMQTAAAAGEVDIQTAVDVAEAKTAFETAKAAITAIVDPLKVA